MPIQPRNDPTPDSSERTRKMQRTASAALYAVLVLVALYTARTFIPAVVWASVIAIALWPAFGWLERRPMFRRHHNVLAVGLTAAIGLLFVVPFFIVAAQTVSEARDMLHWFHEVLRTGLPMPAFIEHLPMGSQQVARWWQENLATPLEASPAVKNLHSATVVAMTRHFGGRVVHGFVIFGFMLMTLFFVFLAGSKLGEQLLAGSRRAFGPDGAAIVRRMAESVRSTVVGLVVVGLGEGALLGVAYAVTGVPHATLLGMLTAVAAMLPFCAPIVFLGSALWLLAQGSTIAAACVAVFGLIVVFVAEHFVRPVLIGGSARLPFLLVLFGILGGAETFGLIGLFIGPALMTILVVLWTDYVDNRS
ncbi:MULTISPECIES: AI-2E family transporter [Caballeronia]|uniref:Membrane protein n=2 Tax=Caballeronia TaxID=1827195 RepID=A0A656QME9_9BURK|nr:MULTISPECIES: AI-2E family transporter [Caballeronia]KDR30698.1 membrane protein [Caballeronia zhejiangensis]MCG7402231.1 AI-2E family transporter [Caballeronia zhejiangensis]MCI1042362.1 AI-2E family transporter [Caballeronia zhejiangensis]MDR5768384.1 AI-2E family transporter [Caballeronia sp. LZ028]MDR5797029.1 AI-2E family transporter [Caballeronia sp. LZ008]